MELNYYGQLNISNLFQYWDPVFLQVYKVSQSTWKPHLKTNQARCACNEITVGYTLQNYLS